MKLVIKLGSLKVCAYQIKYSNFDCNYNFTKTLSESNDQFYQKFIFHHTKKCNRSLFTLIHISVLFKFIVWFFFIYVFHSYRTLIIICRYFINFSYCFDTTRNETVRSYIGFDFKRLLTTLWSTVAYCADARKKMHYRTRKVQLIAGNYLTNAPWKAVLVPPLVPTYFYATMHVYRNLSLAQYFQTTFYTEGKALFRHYNSQSHVISENS